MRKRKCSNSVHCPILQTLGIGVIAGATLAVASVSSNAADQIQPPPYLIAGMSVVSVSVVWDEAAIRKALPPGIEPGKGMTGGINITSIERAYMFGPYSVAYFYVDVEGFDSPEGIKGRWMLAESLAGKPSHPPPLRRITVGRFVQAHRALNPPLTRSVLLAP